MSGAATSFMTANIGHTTGGVVNFRCTVMDDEQFTYRDFRIWFRSTT